MNAKLLTRNIRWRRHVGMPSFMFFFKMNYYHHVPFRKYQRGT